MSSPADTALYSQLRESMVDSQIRARGISDERVLGAMRHVPRHQFALEQYRDQAYEDHPLPIAAGQTISQPYIVAIMLQALRLQPTDRVLEIGTGSGYVTALLAELTSQVVSIERHASLADSAGDLLRRLGYTNVKIVTGDGSRGFLGGAPYEAIIVSAAAAQLPQELVNQLAEGGRMIIPVGIDHAQQLQLIEKQNGEARIRLGELCRFVPLIAGNGS